MVSLLNGTDFLTELSLCLLESDAKSTFSSKTAIIKYIGTGALTITAAILWYKAIQAGRQHVARTLKDYAGSFTSANSQDKVKALAIAEIALRILVDIKQVEPGTTLLNIVQAIIRRKRNIIGTH